MFEVRNSGRVSEAVAGRIYYKFENLLSESVIYGGKPTSQVRLILRTFYEMKKMISLLIRES